jgi:hypothetical protein
MTGILIILALGLFAAPVILPRINRFLSRLNRDAELQMVRLIQEPVLIRSEHPADATVVERAERLRVLVAESGNTWIKPTDVYFRVYKAHMNTGDVYRMTFSVWRAQVEQEYDMVLRRFHAENAKAPEFSNQINGQAV